MRYLLFALLLTVGCEPLGPEYEQQRQAKAQQYMSQLQATCDAYGYQRGTNAYAQCVQGLHQADVKAAAYDERCTSLGAIGRALQGSMYSSTTFAEERRLRGCVD